MAATVYTVGDALYHRFMAAIVLLITINGWNKASPTMVLGDFWHGWQWVNHMMCVWNVVPPRAAMTLPFLDKPTSLMIHTVYLVGIHDGYIGYIYIYIHIYKYYIYIILYINISVCVCMCACVCSAIHMCVYLSTVPEKASQNHQISVISATSGSKSDIITWIQRGGQTPAVQKAS